MVRSVTVVATAAWKLTAPQTLWKAAAGMSIKEFFPVLRKGKSDNLNTIWQDYLKHLAFAMRNLNMIIDSPIIISGYLAPYLVPEDLNMLLHLINENNIHSHS